jgi:heat shock protein HslJ
MIKPILFSTAILLLVSCGPNNTPPPESTPVSTEVIPEKVDGPAVIQDTLPKEEIPVAEEKVVEKEKQIKAATPTKNSEPKVATKPGKPTLHGSWTLDKVYGAKEPFNLLFPNKTPDITFDLKENRLNGNNGCNSYNGPFELKNGVLKIGDDLMSTRMYCEGVKESLFMTTLKMANAYRMEDNNLVLMLDNDDLMRFKPKK